MIILKNGYNLITAANELPYFPQITNLYMDIESKNNFGVSVEGDSDKKATLRKDIGGLYPFGGDRICGIAVTVDDDKAGYYVPIRHTFGSNINLEAVQHWLKHLVTTAENWINHNVVFDATFLHFEGVEFECNLVDTLTLSKLIDSDRYQYGLKPLTVEWLGYSNESVDRVSAYLTQAKSKDWSDVPPDILGEYAIDDVFRNRQLYHYLLQNKTEDLNRVWDTEIKMSSVLYDMEIEGLEVDVRQCKIESLRALRKIITSATNLSMVCEEEFRDSTQMVFDLLVGKLNLPVVCTVKERDEKGREFDTGRPSFDKEAFAIYSVHPAVLSNPEAVKILSDLKVYREESQFFSLYSEQFVAMADEDNKIHPKYNQIIRTGRMSCSRPNIQQQNERSKRLIIPGKGRAFISRDYSQIEFRLIVHYINDLDAIAAYNENPKTDFHQWVSDLLHTKRKAGKQINFGMAYGAGKKRVTASLISNPDIIEEISEVVRSMDYEADKKTSVFNELCSKRASEVYDLYHERLPGIKATAYKASDVCKFRGYVFNAYGRRRHLPRTAAHKAFNSIIQGCAMDVMKDAMVRLSPRFNKTSREFDLRISANVHDEDLMTVPEELMYDEKVLHHIDSILETPSVEFRVPIKTEGGSSVKSWADAK